MVLRTAEARVSLRWAVLDLPGSPQAVVVAAVAVGSEAQRAGVTPGDALLALSDPIRPSELWSLSLPGRGRAGASVRFVRDALRLRALPSVSLVLQPGACGPDPLIVTESGPAGAEAAAGPAAEEAESCALPTASQRRTAKRAAYMEVVAKRSDSSFFAALAAGVLATPAAILLWASNTGWLDPTQGGG